MSSSSLFTRALTISILPEGISPILILLPSLSPSFLVVFREGVLKGDVSSSTDVRRLFGVIFSPVLIRGDGIDGPACRSAGPGDRSDAPIELSGLTWLFFGVALYSGGRVNRGGAVCFRGSVAAVLLADEVGPFVFLFVLVFLALVVELPALGF